MGRKAGVMRVNPKHLTRRTMPCFQEMLVFLSCLHKFNYDDDKVVKEKNALNMCMDVQVPAFVFFFVSSSTAVCFPCLSFLAGLGSLMLPARNLSLKFTSVCQGSSALFKLSFIWFWGSFMRSSFLGSGVWEYQAKQGKQHNTINYHLQRISRTMKGAG